MDWRLLDLIGGYMPAFLIRAAPRLEIPDWLGDSAMNSEELAAATQTHRPSLTRTLRALAAIVNPMVNLGGRLRTEDEHRALLADAGFTAVATTPLPEGRHVYHSVLEADPRAAASTASTMPT